MSNNIDKDIEIVEKDKTLNTHISNYEKSNCKTAVYQELVKERDSMLNVVNELKRNQSALDLVNEMKRKYKIALFMIIRNSTVMPKGIMLGKNRTRNKSNVL